VSGYASVIVYVCAHVYKKKHVYACVFAYVYVAAVISGNFSKL
jgi:hypothetical protein